MDDSVIYQEDEDQRENRLVRENWEFSFKCLLLRSLLDIQVEMASRPLDLKSLAHEETKDKIVFATALLC